MKDLLKCLDCGNIDSYKKGFSDGHMCKKCNGPTFPIGDGVSFEEAFEQVKRGKGMRLPQWKKDVVIRAQYPDEHSKMTAPYLYVESKFGRVPWKETMIELFAENWEVVD